MTDSFSRPGAVDLGAISSPKPAAGGSYVVDVTEANLEAVIAKSLKHPVVLEVTSPRAPGAAELSSALAELANESQGRFLLAHIDVDAAPAIAQALQVQSVPMVAAVIGGQLAPLFQGVQRKEAIAQALDQVYQIAVANGIVGRAEPVPAAPSDGDEEPVADPRLEPAYSAMEAGDFAAAVAEFDKLLVQTPNDAEVKAGRAQASLLVRAEGIDPEAVRGRADDDIESQLVLADVEMIAGRPDAAFARLVNTIALVSADEREPLRLRLLELFDILGPSDPQVVKARRRLTSVLF